MISYLKKVGQNKKMMVFLGVFIVLLFVIGVSYAYWYINLQQSDSNVIASGCFELDFQEEEGSQIILDPAYPLLDQDGVKLNPYKVYVTNTCNYDIHYELNMEMMSSNTLNSKYLKVRVNEGSIALLNSYSEVETTIEGTSESRRLEEGMIDAKSTKEFAIRLWMDGSITSDEKEAMNKTFQSKISITGSFNGYEGIYKESILNGTDPVLGDGLIPVTIGNNGEVRKADISQEWYNYANKEWANAVILFDEKRSYAEGEVIPEENIESYFVWIPRYKYKIFNEGNYEELTNVEDKIQTIEIEFENKEQSVSQGSRVGEWLSHPAFTSFNTNGMWVGKFETGYLGAESPGDALNNDLDSSKVQIKPNVYSWRGIQVAKAHLNSYEYRRDMDSHMMKNTEWGAVAYLSHSKYGSQASVRINNNSSFLTGYAAKNEPTVGYNGANTPENVYENTTLGVDGTHTLNYKNPLSVVASTTGNYSGIYDMSGGAWEYVMGVMMDQKGNLVSGTHDQYNSGFIGMLTYPNDGGDPTKSSWTINDGGISYPDVKYYDRYNYEEYDEHYYRRILGDATGETGPFESVVYGSQKRQKSSWYQDDAFFVTHLLPWFRRGGGNMDGVGSGIFAFLDATGSTDMFNSFRIVLSF